MQWLPLALMYSPQRLQGGDQMLSPVSRKASSRTPTPGSPPPAVRNPYGSPAHRADLSPSPPPRCGRGYGDASLARAILADSPERVLQILDEDPLAALRPCAAGQPPPLVLAVQSGCSPEIVELLLRRGFPADARAADGNTALGTVARAADEVALDWLFGGACSAAGGLPPPGLALAGLLRTFAARRPPMPPLLGEERCVAYASWLLAFGADPAAPSGPDGRSAAECAKVADRPQLAQLLQHWAGAEARALRRLRQRPPRDGCSCRRPEGPMRPAAGGCLLCLPDVLCERVCDALAPCPAALCPAPPEVCAPTPARAPAPQQGREELAAAAAPGRPALP